LVDGSCRLLHIAERVGDLINERLVADRNNRYSRSPV
jgi:hypothetical protein